jgi:hypothetical protein
MTPTRARLTVLSYAVALAGCATMITGSTQTIHIASNEANVKVTVQPGNLIATAPSALTLKRNESGYRLRFEKEGFESVDVRLSSGTNGWVFGNLLIGGIIGLAVDYSNGAAYTLSPDSVTANLKPLAVPPPAGSESRLFIFDTERTLLAVVTLE